MEQALAACEDCAFEVKAEFFGGVVGGGGVDWRFWAVMEGDCIGFHFGDVFGGVRNDFCERHVSHVESHGEKL